MPLGTHSGMLVSPRCEQLYATSVMASHSHVKIVCRSATSEKTKRPTHFLILVLMIAFDNSIITFVGELNFEEHILTDKSFVRMRQLINLELMD